MKNRLKLEQKRLKKQVGMLWETEAFPLLTKFQQRFIICSLYSQIRNNRFEPMNYKYALSRNLNEKWFCHASVYALETGLDSGFQNPSENIPFQFFNSEKIKFVSDIETAQELLSSFSLPAVINIGSKYKNGGRDSNYHTCLSLGKDSNKNIILWEKEGYSYPFRLVTLQKEVDTFSDSIWGIRKLHRFENKKTKPNIFRYILNLFH